MKKSRLRRASPTYLSPNPSPRELSPRPSPILEDCDGEADMSTSRPNSLALFPPHPTQSSASTPPSLQEILANAAPPPWTLSAFMAYLSQNHCLETLEFTMDADRYRVAHGEILDEQDSWVRDGSEHVCSLWRKLMHAYIFPYAPREVNLPARVRDRLLGLPHSPDPPHPSELDEAVKIVYELMNDSVLGPFLESVSAVPPEHRGDADPMDSRQGRSRIRTPRDSSSTAEESSRSPKASFLPQLSIGRGGAAIRSGSSSTETADHDGLTDDTGSSGSPPGVEPMTPPTTPPTSDWAFSTSPGTLHRAISAHSNSWKRMGARLGLSRRGRGKRANASGATSSATDGDSGVGDSGNSNSL